MDSHHQHHGGSPSSSTASSDRHRRPNNNSSLQPSNGNCNSTDPMHSWWESISKARSRIQLLSSLLPSTTVAGDEDPLASLADTDRPARTLLLSSIAYSSISAALSCPTSGSGTDPLCQWLYDTYLSDDPDLRLVVLSYIPLVSAVYLHRIHYPPSDSPVFLAGFEAVLLALYSSEAKSRNGKAVTVSIPDLSQPSLYHYPRNPGKSSDPRQKSTKPLVGILSPPLEPQAAVKSTKRATIVGIALDCFYKQVSQMPNWPKLDFCKFVAAWGGQDCPCTSELDQQPADFAIDPVDEIKPVAERLKHSTISDEDSGRIPLPWELLQPVLRILGHCLLGPSIEEEVKKAASVAVRRLYARASHDLCAQAIIATRSLIRLDKAARDAAAATASSNGSGSGAGSNATTPSKAKKPEVLLVSK